ncbi:hypothetical protein PF005_g28715 [Phytophthora fragariae]|uniref:Uncharacterized protein n=1 Tax=Phytophthora fragariae TaxID=53985 RepID=A0A6A3VL14_9STRA|nr:hypothetical protein PF005_g28715 [Phytophthora fragariae]
MHMIDGISLSVFQVIALGIFVGVTFPPVGMAVAALWVFPVPFIGLLLDGLFIVEIVAAFRLMVGREGFNRILAQRYECFKFVQYITTLVVLSVIYPAYQVLFSIAAGSRYEVLVFLMLPVLKLTMKNLLSLTIPHLEDMLPLEVVFVVDFFNAFYIVTCVQSASSTEAVVTILAIDISQSILELYRLHRRTRSIARKVKQAIGSVDLNHLVLLNAVQNVCEATTCRLKSNTSGQTRKSVVTQILDKCISRNRASVQPLSSILTSARPSSPVDTTQEQSEQLPAKNQPNFLSEALEVIFTSECLVLTEYLEAVIPILYGLYVKVLVNLPSAQYHIELVGTTVDNVDSKLQSVFVYAILEFASLAVLVLVMRKNCGVRALYQLAFVFETQTILVQSKLVTWALITLCFRVVHFGVDFTFKFSWTH